MELLHHGLNMQSWRMFFWFETYREEWERGTVMNAKGLSIFLYFFLYYHFLSSAKVLTHNHNNPQYFLSLPFSLDFAPTTLGILMSLWHMEVQ